MEINYNPKKKTVKLRSIPRGCFFVAPDGDICLKMTNTSDTGDIQVMRFESGILFNIYETTGVVSLIVTRVDFKDC